MQTELWSIGLALVAIFIGSFTTLFLKLGSINLSINPFKLIKNYYFILAILLSGIAAVIYLISLRGGELSTLYPLVATNFIWVTIWSKIFLKETINKWKLMGIFIIIIGISLIGFGS